MAVAEQLVAVDGFSNLEAGVNGGIAPNLLPTNQCHFMVNGRVRSSYPSTRPGFRKLALDWESGENEYAFQAGAFQDAYFYNSPNSTPYLVAVIDGRLWRVPVDFGAVIQEIILTKSDTTLVDADYAVPAVGLGVQVSVASTALMDARFSSLTIGGKAYQLLSIDSDTLVTIKNIDDTPGNTVLINTEVRFQVPDRNASNIRRAYMEQAERYLIVQDGQSAAMIYDGSGARRSDSSKREVPTGTVMAYGLGRLAVARGRNFTVGDIVGGPSGTAVNDFEDAVLKFTENDYLNGGGEFTFPLASGNITAMKHIATPDTALGQGQMLVFTTDAVASVNLPPERETWASLTYPIQTISLINSGGQGSDSTVLVNGDVFFRARDGVRTLIQAVRQFNEWGNTPISRELDRILAYDSQGLLSDGSAVVFNNRLLMTASPVPQYNARSHHKGIIALDFDPVSTMRQKGQPAYDGLWTGIQPIKLLVGKIDGVERCFAFARNNLGYTELWEITLDDRFDRADDEDVAVEASLETRSFIFPGQHASAFPTLKELNGGDLFVDRLSGTVTFDIDYRPDQYPVWQNWHNWQVCATDKDCTAVAGCLPNKSLLPQYRTRMGLPQPADANETTDGKPMRRGYEFQVRINWTGACRLRGFRAKARETQEPVNPVMESTSCVELDSCETDPFTYMTVSYTTGPSFIFSDEDNSMNIALL